MIEIASQHETKTLSTKIAALHEYFLEKGDVETAQKAKQLLLKLHEHEYSIAFCGHFSAGKSSMINEMIGEKLLPSSPIPTSANLVKIKSGEEYAKVNFKEGNPRLYRAPYDFEKVKSYCKDGDSIQSIEISHATNKLPTDACIMDTPGIDSTDDAHRVATESALHLADLIFYVMDYNHVQSELNFLFTKELTEAGKDIYLVINQIDKHQNEELTFDEFKKSVKESFAAWGVKPQEIFYTSLKAMDHPQNQFSPLQKFIQTKLSQREELLPSTILQSLSKLTEEHHQFLQSRDQKELDTLEEELTEISEEEQNLLPSRVELIENQLKEMDEVQDKKSIEFDNRIDSILKNAYLMPYETRALAESYLQATQSDFKVGLFFAKQKTVQEREHRLEKFLLDLQEKGTSQITWHIKEFLNELLKQEEIQEASLLHDVQEFSFPITKEMIQSAVKSGAHVSGEYVLHYTADVAEIVKKAARREVENIKEKYLKMIGEISEVQRSQYEKEKGHYSKLLEAWKQKQELMELHTASLIQMEQILAGIVSLAQGKMEELLSEKEEVEIVTTSELEREENKKVPSNQGVQEWSTDRNVGKKDNQEELATVVKKLSVSSQKLNIPGFKKISSFLKEKAERLEQQSFTVALFGAFSAGKSSFANSLIGSKLLPVSPNPTTAAINKIMPVDKVNTHGLVKVYLKNNDVLFEDVNRSLSVFQMEAANFDEALTNIDKIVADTTSFDAYEKTHFSFLHAFSKGFHAYRNQLGETLHTNIENFREFVANEEKSCLVELIEVHYDCALTERGITLVDTPGADSIDARHTGVAFDYIKNSDAILFVTYYNHAFSKADREFLIQLGRVKDTFEMDKMFFIINAVDLANNEEEKGEVLSYVGDQLVQYGIRNPHLFPVSSLLAIKEKQEQTESNESGLAAFEEHFYSFITHDLTEMAINSALAEWERAVDQLRSFIQSASEDNEQKQQKMESLKGEQAAINKLIESQQVEFLLPRLKQEIEELTYYIKQRVFYRFNDFFKEAFNPSVLRDDGRNLKKSLEHALDDFLEDLGFDFAQELRATTLRVESFMAKLIEEARQTVTKDIDKISRELSFSPYQLRKIEGLAFENTINELERSQFKKVLSIFKNPKAFFEKNEKRIMQDALNESLQEPTDRYLQEETARLLSYYRKALEEEFAQLLAQLLEETADYYQGMYATLSNEIPVQKLIELEMELKTIDKD